MNEAIFQLSGALLFALGFYVGILSTLKRKRSSGKKNKTASGTVMLDKDYQNLLEFDGTKL